jgi:hypothetical protein
MKTKLSVLTILALLFSAQPGHAQFKVEPLPPMPVPVGPLTRVTPLIDLKPIEISPPISALPPKIDDPVYVPPVPPGPAPVPAPPRSIDPIPVYVAPVPPGPGPVSASGGDGPPPMSAEQAFVIAVCANDSDVSSECLEQSGRQAVTQLRGMLLQAFAEGVFSKTISIRFPYMTTPQKQFDFLMQIETVAIAAVQAKMQADIEKLKPFYWDSSGTKAAKWEAVRKDRIAVNNWTQNATAGARSSSNWSHDWHSQTHRFNEGTAYRQLKHVSIHGWGGN